MLASPDADPQTMLDALGYTLGVLGAAAEVDMDRTQADRDYFASEQPAVKAAFDNVLGAYTKWLVFNALDWQRLQARVLLGDVVLDRGVRDAKQDTKRGLRSTSAPSAVDDVFPSDVSDLTDAERRVEPQLVKELVAKFAKLPAFDTRDAIAQSLTVRADNQNRYYAERDAGDIAEAGLAGVLRQAIGAASTLLYQLHKRCLDRFPRQVRFVGSLFLDVAPPRGKKAPPTPTPPTTPA